MKVPVSPTKYTEEEIAESFEQAMKDGTVTDILGNPVTEFDSFAVDEDPQLVPFSIVANCIRVLQGKVLTIIDASFTDEQRIKYVKDLVKDAFCQQTERIFDLTDALEKVESK